MARSKSQLCVTTIRSNSSTTTSCTAQVAPATSEQFLRITIGFSSTGDVRDPDGSGNKMQFTSNSDLTIMVDIFADSYELTTSAFVFQYRTVRAMSEFLALSQSDGPNVGSPSSAAVGPEPPLAVAAPGVGMFPEDHLVTWGVGFSHSVSKNGTLYEDPTLGPIYGDWNIDSSGNKTANGFVNGGDIMVTNPSPGETTFSWNTSITFDIPLTDRLEVISINSTLDSFLRVDCINCVPEPTSLTLAGLGSLGLIWQWRRRRSGPSVASSAK